MTTTDPPIDRPIDPLIDPLIDRQAVLSRFVGPDKPDSGELTLCVHCGFCLNACPTYLELGVETESPRGRLYLMRALDEGRVDLTPRVRSHFDRCLQCRACETACPSLVPFGRLMEATRADLFQNQPQPLKQRFLWRVIMREVFPHPTRLRFLWTTLAWYQRSALQRLVRRSGLLKLVAPNLADLDALAPDATQPIFLPRDVDRYAPPPSPRARVALLTGCVMPLAFGDTHHTTVRVLLRNGVAVDAPGGQICCGALHAHSGDLHTARRLARVNIDQFLAADPDAIIVNSAGCGSHMKEYAHLLRRDPQYAEKAARFAALVKDVQEYLVDLGIDPPRGALNRSVTYQDSCHLVHAQKVTTAPRTLLRQIPGLELREMAHPDRCCGAAGIYSLVQGRIARQILQTKMEEITAAGADQLCTANPGCMLQLDTGLRLFGPGGRSRHVVQLLDESYALAEGREYVKPRKGQR